MEGAARGNPAAPEPAEDSLRNSGRGADLRARLLRLLARCAPGSYSPADTLVEAEKLAKRLRALPALTLSGAGTGCRSRHPRQGSPTGIVALEAALAAEGARPARRLTRLFRIGRRSVASYLALAEQEGNRARLIGGRRLRLSRLARQREINLPVQVRALTRCWPCAGHTPRCAITRTTTWPPNSSITAR